MSAMTERQLTKLTGKEDEVAVPNAILITIF